MFNPFQSVRAAQNFCAIGRAFQGSSRPVAKETEANLSGQQVRTAFAKVEIG
jgi:hypothetical protein